MKILIMNQATMMIITEMNPKTKKEYTINTYDFFLQKFFHQLQTN